MPLNYPPNLSPMDDEDPCFCELAPLYALGVLSEEEQAWVDQQAQTDPDLAEELAQYQHLISLLAYSLPPEPVPTSLRTRLLESLGQESPALQLAWRPYGIPGIEAAVLHLDRRGREVSCLARLQPGTIYPTHRHGGPEEILVLEGELVIEGCIYGQHAFIRSELGSVHQIESPRGCLCFIRTSLDNQFIEA